MDFVLDTAGFLRGAAELRAALHVVAASLGAFQEGLEPSAAACAPETWGRLALTARVVSDAELANQGHSEDLRAGRRPGPNGVRGG